MERPSGRISLARYGRLALLLMSMALVGIACLNTDAIRSKPAPKRPKPPVVGPTPDFAPLASVRWHRSLLPLAPELPALLSALLGRAGVQDEAPDEDGTLVWMRDFHPIMVRRADGETVLVTYLTDNPNRLRHLQRAQDDIRVERLPLVHENGNLVTNGRLVFVSERLLADNSDVRDDPLLVAAGYRPRRRSEIVSLLSAALGRPMYDIIIAPSMPLEETEHVDVWLMFLDEHTAVIPRVRRDAIRALPANERSGAQAVAQYLDARAMEVADLGLRVVRLPMLPPLLVEPSESTAETGREALLLSPANSLLLAHEGRREIVVPHFDMRMIAPEHLTRQRKYERRWAVEFARLGWRVRFVDATHLAPLLGLLRCVTAPYALVKKRESPEPNADQDP